MLHRHVAIIVPGLYDHRWRTAVFPLLTAHWKRHGIEPLLHRMYWNDGELFEPKLARLLAVIDEQLARGAYVSLVGCSAGASAVGNASLARPGVHRVVSICGYLRSDPEHPEVLDRWRPVSRAFVESVRLFEQKEPSLSREERAKWLTIRPRYGDGLVPAEASVLAGATNIHIPGRGHFLGITTALSIFSCPLLEFLNRGSGLRHQEPEDPDNNPTDDCVAYHREDRGDVED